MVDSITRTLTDDGLSNTVTEIERTDQQTAQQLNDTYHNKHCSGYPFEFSVGVQQVHQTQVSSDCTWTEKQLSKINFIGEARTNG